MSNHPSLESLLALTLGELSDDEAFELREHLIGCESCRLCVKEFLETPDEPPIGEPRLTDSERSKAWAGLAEKLGTTGRVLGPEPPQKDPKVQPAMAVPFLPYPAPSHRLPATTHRWPIALMGTTAAAVALAFGTGLFMGRSHGTGLETATQVAVWTPLTGDLGARRGTQGPSTEPTVICPEEKRALVWALNLGAASPLATSRLRVEIISPDGTIETLDRVPRDEFGRVLLTRSRESTPDGAYMIRVFSEHETEALETFYCMVSCG